CGWCQRRWYYPNKPVILSVQDIGLFSIKRGLAYKIRTLLAVPLVDFNNKEIKHFKSVGSTTERTVDIETGEVLRQFTGHASSAGLTISNQSISSTSATFKLRASAANPLVSSAPTIDWEYTITVTNTGKVTVNGAHDGYPAHEIYKRVDYGTPTRIYTHDPRVTGETPASLAPPMEHSVNRTV
ncbi:DUF3238 domain-containing protein, partial [Paenibacillus sp. MER 78]